MRRTAVNDLRHGGKGLQAGAADEAGGTIRALRVTGGGVEPHIPDGALLIVDQAAEAKHGSLVVVCGHGAAPELFRLAIEAGACLLLALDSRQPALPLGEGRAICGVVRQIAIDLP